MAISRAERRSLREADVRRVFGDEADAALDLLELVEYAWHDCFGEVTPSEGIIADMLTCSRGDLATLVRATLLGVQDYRDLRLWADDIRSGANGRQ